MEETEKKYHKIQIQVIQQAEELERHIMIQINHKVQQEMNMEYMIYLEERMNMWQAII